MAFAVDELVTSREWHKRTWWRCLYRSPELSEAQQKFAQLLAEPHRSTTRAIRLIDIDSETVLSEGRTKRRKADSHD